MIKMFKLFFASLLLFLALDISATTWNIGPLETYTKPSQVMTLVDHGDTILIQAGEYLGDVGTWTKSDLVIIGVNGMAHLRANGNAAAGKAIWVAAGNNLYVENIEFSEATVPDKNGAGIRVESGVDLHVNHCYFHHNETGVLSSNSGGNIIIEYSEFNNNGYGNGFSHNIYIGHIDRFVLRYSYIHHAIIGHNVKSRAANNEIVYNRIMDEETGYSSRLLDLPNGGKSFVIGNLFMQGTNAENSNLIGYGYEGLSNAGIHDLYLINNTCVNKKGTGLFLYINAGTNMANVTNNIFVGGGTIIEGNTTLESNNYENDDISAVLFVDEINYDYRIEENSPVINGGLTQDSVDLNPDKSYSHPSNYVLRPEDGFMDIGAYEYELALAINNLDGFNCELINGSTHVSWKVSDRNVIYDLERSRDLDNWKTLFSKNFDISESKVLRYRDDSIEEGTYYYRLKVIDLHDYNRYKYSTIKQIDKFKIGVFPNPFKNFINFEIPFKLGNQIDFVEIYDSYGKLINRVVDKNGIESGQLNTSDWNAGIYYFRFVMDKNNSVVLRLIK